MAGLKHRVGELIRSNRALYDAAGAVKRVVYTWPKKQAHRVVRRLASRKRARNRVSAKTLAAQRAYVFPEKHTVSVLVPLYNTPLPFLEAMIASVQAQTYADWELCLADGSDAAHAEVGETCRRLAAQDGRIKYRLLAENLGISGNTNACIEMASGEYLALFDHDDLLHPSALYEVMRAVQEQGADFVYTDEAKCHKGPQDAYQPHFKPDFAIDNLRANNYICHLTVFRRALLDEAGGGFRTVCDGAQDFDLVLRLTEKARRIVHIPQVLYYWRSHAQSTAQAVGAKPYVLAAGRRAVDDHLARVGLRGHAEDSTVPSMYRVQYELTGKPLVSILIPNKDHVADLSRCIDSVLEKSTYRNFEIIIIENGSMEQATFDYYASLTAAQPCVRVIEWHEGFNYSAINNFGFREAKGEQILLLNNDIEVITPDWLEQLLMYAQRPDVGAVGAKLYYPDRTIQHAGLGVGLLTLAGSFHKHFPASHPGYMGRLIYAQDMSAVTAACMMVPRRVYEQVGGLDEGLAVAFNDVDLCMKIRAAGHLIVWTPCAELYHYESVSRGLDRDPAKRRRFVGEVERFQTRWAKELAAGDPYFNPNFNPDYEDFSVRW